MKEKLIEFIQENNLNFNGKGSNLNGMCTVLSGYALHLGVDYNIMKEAIAETFPKAVGHYEAELLRVFEYAQNNAYEKYWSTEEAKSSYKF